MAVTRNEVTELYVAFFDRAPDADGLDYWVNDSGLAIEDISQSFFDQPETQEKYPETLSNADFVNTIYTNMFNHDADADGLVYWVDELESGSISRADMILAIANGALGDDQIILDNKTEVGLYFADAGLNDVDQATDVMSGVTEDTATVAQAKSEIDGYASIDLTPGQDTIVGTDADETINGADTTYTLGDSIDGGAGEDTFALNLSAAFAAGDPIAAINNVESIVITDTFGANGANALDASNWSGLNDYTFNNNGFATTINNVTEEISSITMDKITNAAGAQAFINVVPTLYTGIEDALDVTLSNSSATAVVQAAPGVIETLNITSTGNNGAAALNVNTMDAVTTAINVSGDSSLTVITGGTVVNTVDASALNAGLTYASTFIAAGLVPSETITGGTGNDALTANGVATINGGTGNDTINAAAFNTTVTGGAGMDTINLAGGTDVIKYDVGDTGLTTQSADLVTGFTAGTDTISFSFLGAGTGNATKTVTPGAATVEAAVVAANAAFSGGDNTYVIVDGNYLAYDSNADKIADGIIDLTGSGITAADIV